MKGNDRMIETLNRLLADELTAISQYMVHAKMCENWGFEKLYHAIEGQSRDEMHHAEWLIERILFLEGTPIVDRLNPMHIGKSVVEIITNDMQDELGAVRAYNEGIALAHEVGDQATGDLLMKILHMEEGHIDWAETQLARIEQMGLANYLVTQTEDGEED